MPNHVERRPVRKLVDVERRLDDAKDRGTHGADRQDEGDRHPAENALIGERVLALEVVDQREIDDQSRAASSPACAPADIRVAGHVDDLAGPDQPRQAPDESEARHDRDELHDARAGPAPA